LKRIGLRKFLLEIQEILDVPYHGPNEWCTEGAPDWRLKVDDDY
jgi:hypothetical protein